MDQKWIRWASNGTNHGLLFLDQMSVHFSSANQDVLKSELKEVPN